MRSYLAAVLALLGIGPHAALRADTMVHDIMITQRHLYGPGPFPDQPLGAGHVKSMNFDSFMSATVPAFNNGGAPPNASGEAAQGSTVDGMMSDGTKINEHIDMGNARILNGQFNLVLGAVFGGPNAGYSYFFLDKEFNWTILDDIAMDPGFAEGIIKVDNFLFTTGPKPVPFSIQTATRTPGGIDRVGTLKSGEVMVGRIGDQDQDGHVDGIFFAMGQFPLKSAFLPGAPFVQRVHFTSDIPLAAADAALLAAAGARNCLRMWRRTPPEVSLGEGSVQRLSECATERAATAVRDLKRAVADRKACGAHCAELARIGEQLPLHSFTANTAASSLDHDLEALERLVPQIAKLQQRAPSGLPAARH